MITLNMTEVLRYLGMPEGADEHMQKRVRHIADKLTGTLQPRFIYRVFPIERCGTAFMIRGTELLLSGKSAETMMDSCDAAALLACTLGTEFDSMLRSAQARDMTDAAILDACGGAWVEAGCDEAERELSKRLSGKYFTDRFSPGYGDLPLSLQAGVCGALDAEKRIGIYVLESDLINPVKSVTAIIGISDVPQRARIRGCAYCAMKGTCRLRKVGKNCGI